MMDPERFAIEQPFVEVTRELIQLQQELAHKMKMSKAGEVIAKLKDQKDLNDAYIELLTE